MILRLSTFAARGFFVLAALAFAVAISYSSIRIAVASHAAELNTRQGYERATQLEPEDAANWYLLGRYWQYNLDNPDTHRAILDYQRSLSLDPHAADAWLDLATAYESENNATDARTAFMQAKRAYPLSPDVSWRYGNFLLRRSEMDSAFAEIKHAVEEDPNRAVAAFSLAMRVEPNANRALDRALPPSPDVYLRTISSLSDQDRPDGALVVWSRLVALHPQLPARQSFALIDSLRRHGRIAEAQSIWDQALGIARTARPPDPPGSLVWDGGFESDLSGGGFAWRYPLPGAVQILRDLHEKHSGNYSLRLIFNGLSNVDFHDVCQFVPVQPSTSYRLSAWFQTRALSTDQGLRLGLYSNSDAGTILSWSEDVRETQPWNQINLLWTSGHNVHEAQLCLLRLPSTKSDGKLQGSVWIDDVALIPVSGETPKR
jgi:tetratricopeptide (TPR) repeat protein